MVARETQRKPSWVCFTMSWNPFHCVVCLWKHHPQKWHPVPQTTNKNRIPEKFTTFFEGTNPFFKSPGTLQTRDTRSSRGTRRRAQNGRPERGRLRGPGGVPMAVAGAGPLHGPAPGKGGGRGVTEVQLKMKNRFGLLILLVWSILVNKKCLDLCVATGSEVSSCVV